MILVKKQKNIIRNEMIIFIPYITKNLEKCSVQISLANVGVFLLILNLQHCFIQSSTNSPILLKH